MGVYEAEIKTLGANNPNIMDYISRKGGAYFKAPFLFIPISNYNKDFHSIEGSSCGSAKQFDRSE
jgi:hypothetical protein